MVPHMANWQHKLREITYLNRAMTISTVALMEAQIELDDLNLVGMFVDDAVAILRETYKNFDIKVAEPSAKARVGVIDNTTIWVWISSESYRVTALVHQ